MRIEEIEKIRIKYLLENGRKDLAKIYYMPREMVSWGKIKELIIVITGGFLKYEKKDLCELERILLKIEEKYSLDNDKYIGKPIYDYVAVLVEKFNEERINQNLIPIMQHNGLFDMLFNILKLPKNFDIEVPDNKIDVKTKTGSIQFNNNTNIDTELMIKSISSSQIQVLCYCIHLQQTMKTDKLTFNIKDYFELRGIVRQTKSVHKLIRDFQIIECMFFSFSANVKGKKQIINNNQVLKVIEINTKKNEIIFEFGEWINTLSNKQYSLFNKKFFKYKSGNNFNSHIIILSLKLNEIIRNNLNKKKDKNSIKVGKFFDILVFNQSTIKAKGFVIACQDPIEQALDEIGKNEGYLWNYRKGEYKNLKEYKEDYIDIENPIIFEAYKKVKEKKYLVE